MQDHLKNLMRLVVEEVVATGEPVGSQHLVLKHGLDMSPATVRNWFATLDQEGYLTQPHASSGRVPTEKGYRFYLKELMEERGLKRRDQQDLESATDQFDQTADGLKRLTHAVSDLTDHAVIMVRRDGSVFSSGMARLFSQPEFFERDMVVSFGGMFDHVDEIMNQIMGQQFAEPTALIGDDCPFGKECGSVVLNLNDETLLSLVGPMRMDYGRSFALLRQIQDLIDQD